MFISPALEELTGASTDPANSQHNSLPSAVHDPPAMNEDMDVPGFGRKQSSTSRELESFQSDLERQLVGVTEQTFDNVKQAVQTAVEHCQDTANVRTLVQVSEVSFSLCLLRNVRACLVHAGDFVSHVSVGAACTKQAVSATTQGLQKYGYDLSSTQSAKESVLRALHSSSSGCPEDSKSAFATIADAVTSAGNAIGQLSSQVLGGGQVRFLGNELHVDL